MRPPQGGTTGLTTGLSVDVGSAAKQIRALRAGEIDLAISGALVSQPGLRITTFGRQALVAILPRDHALAAQDSIALADFGRHPCVLLSPDAPVGATVHQAFADQGIVPQRIMTAVDPPLAVGLAAVANLGVRHVEFAHRLGGGRGFLGAFGQCRADRGDRCL